MLKYGRTNRNNMLPENDGLTENSNTIINTEINMHEKIVLLSLLSKIILI